MPLEEQTEKQHQTEMVYFHIMVLYSDQEGSSAGGLLTFDQIIDFQ